jgi:hypothetical protein
MTIFQPDMVFMTGNQPRNRLLKLGHEVINHSVYRPYTTHFVCRSTFYTVMSFEGLTFYVNVVIAV